MSFRNIYLLISMFILVGCNYDNPLNPEYYSDGFDIQ